MDRAADNEFGSATMTMTDGLKQLAMLYEAQGNYAEAEPLYVRALAIEENPWGRTVHSKNLDSDEMRSVGARLDQSEISCGGGIAKRDGNAD